MIWDDIFDYDESFESVKTFYGREKKRNNSTTEGGLVVKR